MDPAQREPGISPHPVQSAHGLRGWSGKVRDWARYYWPCLVLAAFALIGYVAVLGYQARRPVDEARYQVWATRPVAWGEDEAMFAVAYPGELRLESPGEPRPISVWLQRATSTPGSTPTPTLTPTPTPISTGTLPLTPTPTGTPRPWIVAFSPHDEGVLFTDREGVPTAPQVALTPGAESAAPAVLYVQRAPLATKVSEATLDVSVYGPDGSPVPALIPVISIALESGWSAWWRHFWDLLCGGPTAPLLAFAAGLVAFATQVWQRRSQQQEEERKRRLQRQEEERKREVLAEVARLAYLRSQPTELILKYWELQERTESEPDWKDPHVIECLKHTLDTLSPEDLLGAIAEWFGHPEDEEAIRCAELALSRDRSDETARAFRRALDYAQASRQTDERFPEDMAEGIARALSQVYDVCGDAGKARAAQLVADLGRRQAWDAERIRTYGVSAKHLRWLDLWPSAPPADPKPVTDWIRTVGLRFNPFGPEVAELDPRLRRYGLGAVFEHIRGRRAVLVFGKSGFGKTAAALLLASYCEDPPIAPREAGAFPVYCALPTAASLSAEHQPLLLVVAHAAAQAVARYLAHRPEGFLYLPESRKISIVRLLSLWSGSREMLDARLRQAGPAWGTSSRLKREVTAMYQEVSCTQCLGDLADLLASAPPRGFECTYLILDLSSAPTQPRLRASIAMRLLRLLDLTVPLAARRVYLKLFLPEALRPHLGDLSAYEVFALAWSAENLTAMLEARVQAATGTRSLMPLCGADVPGEPNLDVRLVRAADGSPRQLVRLGNELLRRHVQFAPGRPLLSAEEIDSVVGPLKGPAQL